MLLKAATRKVYDVPAWSPDTAKKVASALLVRRGVNGRPFVDISIVVPLSLLVLAELSVQVRSIWLEVTAVAVKPEGAAGGSVTGANRPYMTSEPKVPI